RAALQGAGGSAAGSDAGAGARPWHGGADRDPDAGPTDRRLTARGDGALSRSVAQRAHLRDPLLTLDGKGAAVGLLEGVDGLLDARHQHAEPVARQVEKEGIELGASHRRGLDARPGL